MAALSVDIKKQAKRRKRKTNSYLYKWGNIQRQNGSCGGEITSEFLCAENVGS